MKTYDVILLILDDTYTIGTMAVYDQFYSNDQTVHDGVIQGFYEDVSAGVHSIKFRVFKRTQDVYIGINWFSHTSLLTVMEIGA